MAKQSLTNYAEMCTWFHPPNLPPTFIDPSTMKKKIQLTFPLSFPLSLFFFLKYRFGETQIDLIMLIDGLASEYSRIVIAVDEHRVEICI